MLSCARGVAAYSLKSVRKVKEEEVHKSTTSCVVRRLIHLASLKKCYGRS